MEWIPESTVREMVSAQRHRGPDAASIRHCGQAILGSNRLRIIDVRDVADQPLVNEDGTVSVVFNGEIYNYKDLRSELQGRGHIFRTDTDTEVLVHLYEDHGLQLLEHLRGMFGFVLWDHTNQELFAARDRLGIKPLYYVWTKGTLSLASEARALAARGRQKFNEKALMGYLQFGWVPSPRTIFDGVNELPPGHFLKWSKGEVEIQQWWDPLDLRKSNRPKRHAGLLRSSKRQPEVRGPDQDLAEALRDSVCRHLVADVPVGLFLSSGLDSCALAFLASKQAAEIDAFTVALDGASDETAEASRWARRFGLAHTSVRVSGNEVLEHLPQFIASLDQPTVDGLNTWIVSRAVSEAGIKVALSGLGGDELFEGYSTFRRLPMIHRLGRMARVAPQRLRSATAGRVEATFDHHLTKRAAEAISDGGWPSAYASMRGVMGRRELQRLAPGRGGNPLDELTFVVGDEALDTVLQLELRNYLPQQLLRDTDITGMAHSLEVRVPLLDDAVVTASLRPPYGTTGQTGKARLAAAVDSSLLELLLRPKKTFTLPINSWMKGPLRTTAHQAIARLAEPDLDLDRWELSSIWNRFQEGRVHWRTVWALTALGLWVDNQRV